MIMLCGADFLGQALIFPLRATPFDGMTRNQVRRVPRASEISAPAVGRPCRNKG